jgi:flagellar basal-body rod protein FlgB
MIENIGGVTSQVIGATLDALSIRHQFIANNVANVNTLNYSKQSLNFESQLKALLSSIHSNEHPQTIKQEFIDFKEKLKSDEFVSSSDEVIDLDEQMVELTENTLRYQALLTASGKRGSIIKMAIREGR